MKIKNSPLLFAIICATMIAAQAYAGDIYFTKVTSGGKTKYVELTLEEYSKKSAGINLYKKDEKDRDNKSAKFLPVSVKDRTELVNKLKEEQKKLAAEDKAKKDAADKKAADDKIAADKKLADDKIAADKQAALDKTADEELLEEGKPCPADRVSPVAAQDAVDAGIAPKQVGSTFVFSGSFYSSVSSRLQAKIESKSSEDANLNSGIKKFQMSLQFCADKAGQTFKEFIAKYNKKDKNHSSAFDLSNTLKVAGTFGDDDLATAVLKDFNSSATAGTIVENEKLADLRPELNLSNCSTCDMTLEQKKKALSGPLAGLLKDHVKKNTILKALKPVEKKMASAKNDSEIAEAMVMLKEFSDLLPEAKISDELRAAAEKRIAELYALALSKTVSYGADSESIKDASTTFQHVTRLADQLDGLSMSVEEKSSLRQSIQQVYGNIAETVHNLSKDESVNNSKADAMALSDLMRSVVAEQLTSPELDKDMKPVIKATYKAFSKNGAGYNSYLKIAQVNGVKYDFAALKAKKDDVCAESNGYLCRSAQERLSNFYYANRDIINPAQPVQTTQAQQGSYNPFTNQMNQNGNVAQTQTQAAPQTAAQVPHPLDWYLAQGAAQNGSSTVNGATQGQLFDVNPAIPANNYNYNMNQIYQTNASAPSYLDYVGSFRS